MAYLLDTNILIAALRGAPAIRARLEATSLSEIVLSPIVLGELELGVAKSRQPTKNADQLKAMVRSLALCPLDSATSRAYGEIRSRLEVRGTPIGANDYWIAAQAYALGAVLVTDNEKEFKRVRGLAVENWLA